MVDVELGVEQIHNAKSCNVLRMSTHQGTAASSAARLEALAHAAQNQMIIRDGMTVTRGVTCADNQRRIKDFWGLSSPQRAEADTDLIRARAEGNKAPQNLQCIPAYSRTLAHRRGRPCGTGEVSLDELESVFSEPPGPPRLCHAGLRQPSRKPVPARR